MKSHYQLYILKTFSS